MESVQFEKLKLRSKLGKSCGGRKSEFTIGANYSENELRSDVQSFNNVNVQCMCSDILKMHFLDL